MNVEGWAKNGGGRVKKKQRVHFVGKDVISLGKGNLLIASCCRRWALPLLREPPRPPVSFQLSGRLR